MAENPVMPESIEQLLTKVANVPVIISYTAHEYIMFLRGKIYLFAIIIFLDKYHNIDA